MLSQVDWRRVATASFVLLLHLLVLLALLNVTGIIDLRTEGLPHEIMLTLSPPAPKPSVALPAPPEEPLPIPYAILPEAPRAITAPPLRPDREREPPGDMGAIGRYLFNCSGGYYEQMTEREKEHCLSNLWGNERPKPRTPVLGEAKPSPFDSVIQERNTPAISPFKQCDPGSINASLHNVPCVDFTNSHSILNEVPGH